MLLVTKKAVEHVAAAATHTAAEQPPCEATGHTGSARYKGLITERPMSKCVENRNHSKAPKN